eukprot:461881_1
MGNNYGSVNQKDNTTRSENQINVGCYNVYYEGYDRQGTIDAICDMKVDILILQETNSKWEEVITNNKMVKSKFKYIQCVNDKWREGGTILLTNYQIKSLDIIDRYHEWWYAAHRFILCLNENIENTNEILIQLYSIHLIAPYPPVNSKSRCCGIYCCGEDKNQFRLKEIKHFLNEKYYDCSLPTLIVGDFNCMDGNCHNYLNNSLSLNSSWSNLNKNHRYLMCCKHKPYSWRGMLCNCCCFAPKLFDHIYFSSTHFKLIHSDVLQIGQSDHFPVY